MKNYQTKQGDTFDSIAFRVYGNRCYTRELMEANPCHLDVVVFSGGISLKLPEIAEERAKTSLPPWRVR